MIQDTWDLSFFPKSRTEKTRLLMILQLSCQYYQFGVYDIIATVMQVPKLCVRFQLGSCSLCQFPTLLETVIQANSHVVWSCKLGCA